MGTSEATRPWTTTATTDTHSVLVRRVGSESACLGSGASPCSRSGSPTGAAAPVVGAIEVGDQVVAAPVGIAPVVACAAVPGMAAAEPVVAEPEDDTWGSMCATGVPWSRWMLALPLHTSPTRTR
jgi:hypothetical protein